MMLDQLVDLAREPSPDARGALLQSVADIFLTGIGKHTAAELELFTDILLRLLGNTNEDHRAALSRKMAPYPETPSKVAMQLAGDVLAVARPVLEQSKALGPDQLLELAKRLDQSHLEAIARREDLAPKVSDTLVQRGKTPVLRTLAGNRKINLSDHALRSLARHAVKDVVLRENFTLRSDLTPTICEWLLPFVNERTRERLQQVIAGTLSKADMDGIAERQRLRRHLGTLLDTADTRRLWQEITKGTLSLDDLILLLLEDNRLINVADLLAMANSQDRGRVRTVVFSGDIDPLVECATNAGLRLATFRTLAIVICSNLRIPQSQASMLTDRYLEVNPELAPQKAS